MQNSLRNFEKKIQSLVENNSDSLFSSTEKLSNYLSEIKEAFLSIDQLDDHRNLIGPTSILLSVSENSPLLSNQEIIRHFSIAIQELASLFDFASESPIKLKIIEQKELKTEELLIELIFDKEAKHNAASQYSANQGINRVPAGAFFIVNGKEIFPLKNNIINIGRFRENHLVIEDPQVSRRHGQLRVKENSFEYIDLNSSAGSVLNGDEISRAVLLPGDVLKLAGFPLIYGQDSAIELIETQEIELRDKDKRTTSSDPTIVNK